jgi:hypothetical protein
VLVLLSPVHLVLEAMQVLLFVVPQQGWSTSPQATHMPGDASPVPHVTPPPVQISVLPPGPPPFLAQHAAPDVPHAPASDAQAPAVHTPPTAVPQDSP